MDDTTGRGNLKKVTPVFEVNVRRLDEYDQVVSKILEAVGTDDDDKEWKLFTAGGSIIMDTTDDNFSWSLGSYLNKKHISPEKLKLGVGFVQKSSTNNRVQQAHKKRKVCTCIQLCVLVYILCFNEICIGASSFHGDENDLYEGLLAF